MFSGKEMSGCRDVSWILTWECGACSAAALGASKVGSFDILESI